MILTKVSNWGTAIWFFDKPRWDPTGANAHGATITYDFDARDGGIPFQTIKEKTHAFQPT